MRRVLFVALLAACGAKPAPLAVPTLPHDGTAHIAQPTALPAVSKSDDPWAGRTDLIVPPAPQAPHAEKLPAIQQFQLANGLQVYVIPDDHLPIASMQLAIRAGRMDEPRARLGVSEATADMIVKGTKRRDAIGMAKTIDFVGGTIAADSTYEATLVSCSVLSKDLPTCFDLVPDMVEHATFPTSELDKIKAQMIGEVRQRLDDAATLATAEAENLLWGNNHVRGWMDSEESVRALRREDLIAFHDAWYRPNNAMLVIAGNVDAKKLKPQLDRAFGTWKKQAVPPTPKYADPGLSGIRIRLVDKPGQTQTQIRIAQFGISHADPKFFDTLVWNYALGGGGFSSRLMKVVRAKDGKTYGAQSGFDRNLDKGTFLAQTFTRNSEAVATAKLVLDQIAKMAAEGPSQDEVEAAIANLAGGYGMRFQSAADLGSALISAELDNYGTEYLTNYPLAVGKVTVDTAKQAASEVLDPHDYVLVLVGDAKDLEPQLQKEGWRYQKVSYAQPMTPFVEAPPDAAKPVDAKALAAAHRLIEQALAAKGGKKRLAKLASITMTAAGTTTVRGQTLPVSIDRVFVVPDKMRIDAEIANRVKVIVAVDGEQGWQLSPGQGDDAKPVLTDLQKNDLGAVDFERWREPELILMKADDASAKLVPEPDDTIDGKPQDVLALGSPFQDLDVKLYIDKKTKLVTRMTYSDNGETETDDFGDYRTVDGVKVAFKRISSTADRTTALEISKVTLDAKVDPKTFAKPGA